MLIVFSILIKYRQIREQIHKLEPDKAGRNIVLNRELALRSSSRGLHRSSTDFGNPGREHGRYHPAG